MANPLHAEEKIYKAIEDNKLQIPQEIWELLNHHLRNDDQVIMFGADDLRRCILELVQTLTVNQSNGKPLSPDDLIASLQELVNICDAILIRGRCIERFLVKLTLATHQNQLVGSKKENTSQE